MDAMITAHQRPHQTLSFRPLIAGALGLVAVSMLTGFAFAAWTANGPALFNALAANGLAWCL